MYIGSGSSSHAPAWPLIPARPPIIPSGDAPVATQIASIATRVATEPGQKDELPPHLWVEKAPTRGEAAYRWLDGMVDVLKQHGAYNIAVDNYRAIHPRVTHKEAEKLFAVDLLHAVADPVPERISRSVNGNHRFFDSAKAVEGYRWKRVVDVLKDSGAYAAGIAHYQVYRVQRLAQACRDWTAFFKSRGMDDATIEKFLPERPRMMSWDKANSTFMGQLMRVGDPRHLSRHLASAPPMGVPRNLPSRAAGAA